MAPLSNASLRALLKDHQDGHSDFQADYFITLRAGGTPYGCYKQALRELSKRCRGLRELHIQRKLLLLEITELRRLCGATNCRHGSNLHNGRAPGASRGLRPRIIGLLARLSARWSNCFRNPAARQRNCLILAQKRMALAEIDRSIAETGRELRRFWRQAAALKQQVGELTPERRGRLERRMWRHKLKSAAAVDLITRGVLSEKTVELLLCIPPAWRCALLEEIKEQDRLLEWFRNYQVRLPHGSQPSGDRVRRRKSGTAARVTHRRVHVS